MPAKEEYSWKEHAQFSPSRYVRFLQTVLSDINYSRALVEVVDPSDADALAVSLINVGHRAGVAMNLIRAVLDAEFRNSKHAETVLRAGSCATKMMAAFVRKIGLDYLRSILRPVLLEIIAMGDDTMEIDPGKFPRDMPSEAVEEAVVRNQQRLLEAAERMHAVITSKTTLSQLPREIRAIAGHIASLCEQYFPASMAPLVGGFIMLRFINPAVLAPEAFGVIEEQLTPAARRNLILIAKMLQNLSNSVQFDGLKEQYMVPMNPFVTRHADEMMQYLHMVATDPLAIGDQTPFADVCLSVMSPTTTEPLDFHLQDLVVIHRILDRRGAKILVCLQNYQLYHDSSASSLFAKDSDFFVMMKEMGPPPPRLSSSRKAEVETDMEQKLEQYVNQSISNIQSRKESIDTSRLDSSEVLWRGGKSLAGNPVFYLSVRRLKPEHLVQPDLFVVYVVKTMQEALNDPYEIVVDMSWTAITSEFKMRAFGVLTSMFRVFGRVHKENLTAVYILHPSTFTRNAVSLAMAFISAQSRKRIIELFDWRDLHRFIAPENLKLDSDSKTYFTKCYNALKVNTKQREQPRLIKVTTESILNIDPRTSSIKSEVLLTDILEIGAEPNSPRLTIRFAVSTARESLVGFFFSRKSLRGVAETRRYLCASVQERDAVLEDIFANRHKFEGSLPQAYTVSKNNGSRRVDRVIKLTADSMLRLNGPKIRKETHFVNIEQTRLDPVDPQVVWIKFKKDEEERKLYCDKAVELVAAIKEGMMRFENELSYFEGDEQTESDDVYAESNSDLSLPQLGQVMYRNRAATTMARLDSPSSAAASPAPAPGSPALRNVSSAFKRLALVGTGSAPSSPRLGATPPE